MTLKNQDTGKSGKIIYWVATIWLALGMTSTGIVQFLKTNDEVNMAEHLGYPLYFLTLLAFWKLSGVIVILIPRWPLLKEWTYAGFFFAMSGAVFSHMAKGDGPADFFGPILLLVLTIVSWYFRPQERKLITLGWFSKSIV